MRLRDPKLLVGYMEMNDFTQARLARHAECSRQFIHMLVTGEKTTCTPAVGERIEEALRVLPGTLFVPKESTVVGPAVKTEATETRRATSRVSRREPVPA
ncbi:helix-turn-helix transcriptional regulator [Georgenia sp. MJ206]|uniref:helix-turn-helix domain-containing protein n=1 Tax=Georgenia wangjunii TaxID=3117730 RepID=UPI002F2668B2